MVRLHGSNHTESREPADVTRTDVLRMLDTETPVACAVLLRDACEHLELRGDRTVTNRVHDHLQPRPVGT